MKSIDEQIQEITSISEDDKLKNSKITVAVGMSGGVDSSVAAYLVKSWGYKVIGLFMKNWDEENSDLKGESKSCTAYEDYEDVRKVAEKLDIPYYTIDFVDEYWERVFSPSIEEFKKGFTPNPDVLCNREIKFNAFYEKARSLGADKLATGHYCQTKKNEATGKWELIRAIDGNKDQSYFLHMVKHHVLENVLFPIGHIEKPIVREIARKIGLSTSDKKDSTGICFIGERHFQTFLSNYIPEKVGNFETLTGEIVGTHKGAHFYTVGQRKGLGLGGPGEPWYVIGKDVDKNTVTVERGEAHPSLYSKKLFADEVTFVAEDIEFPSENLKCKVRYRQKDQDCQLVSYDSTMNRVVIEFPEPQRAVTLGQSVVFYLGDVCLGGGIVRGVLA